MVGGAISLLTGLIFIAQMATFRSELRMVYVGRGIIPAGENTTMGNP
jgi:hypothetical protein